MNRWGSKQLYMCNVKSVPVISKGHLVTQAELKKMIPKESALVSMEISLVSWSYYFSRTSYLEKLKWDRDFFLWGCKYLPGTHIMLLNQLSGHKPTGSLSEEGFPSNNRLNEIHCFLDISNCNKEWRNQQSPIISN